MALTLHRSYCPDDASENIFFQLTGADYVDGTDTPRGFPGTSPVVPPANQVSNATFRVERTNKGNGHLTVLFMTFGQFFDHDLALATHPECHEKRLALSVAHFEIMLSFQIQGENEKNSSNFKTKIFKR